ncbi:MAG: hypothetical protein QM528_03295 [Phycisphaerales bacterium]|nr:hypothetical protein [Phycisphaerales bacterium]
MVLLKSISPLLILCIGLFTYCIFLSTACKKILQADSLTYHSATVFIVGFNGSIYKITEGQNSWCSSNYGIDPAIQLNSIFFSTALWSVKWFDRR